MHNRSHRFVKGLVFALATLLLAGSVWAAASHSEALNEGRNFDARVKHTESVMIQKSLVQESSLAVRKPEPQT